MRTRLAPRLLVAALPLLGCSPEPPGDPLGESADPSSGSGATAEGESGSLQGSTGSGGAADGASTTEDLTGAEASTSGASTGSDGTDTEDLPPPGTIPMFVAVGRGGRTITSCDGGWTWINDRSLSDNNEDHHEHTDKGLAYGDGVFVQLLGWGAPSSLQISTDGIEWLHTPAPEGGWGSVAFVDGAFVLASAGGSAVSLDGGATWQDGGPPQAGSHVREGGGGSGVMIVGPTLSATGDQGLSWSSVQGCPAGLSFGGVGQYGGMMVGSGRAVVFDEEGRFCTSEDEGVSWTGGQVEVTGPRARHGKASWADGRFWYMNGSQALVSEDGLSWDVVIFEPAGVDIHAIAHEPGGAFVGFDRHTSDLYISDDGHSWSPTESHPGPTSLVRLQFGYALPSAQCPQ